RLSFPISLAARQRLVRPMAVVGSVSRFGPVGRWRRVVSTVSSADACPATPAARSFGVESLGGVAGAVGRHRVLAVPATSRAGSRCGTRGARLLALGTDRLHHSFSKPFVVDRRRPLCVLGQRSS